MEPCPPVCQFGCIGHEGEGIFLNLSSNNFYPLFTFQDSAGAGFDDHGGELELHSLDFSTINNLNTSLIGSVKSK